MRTALNTASNGQLDRGCLPSLNLASLGLLRCPIDNRQTGGIPTGRVRVRSAATPDIRRRIERLKDRRAFAVIALLRARGRI